MMLWIARLCLAWRLTQPSFSLRLPLDHPYARDPECGAACPIATGGSLALQADDVRATVGAGAQEGHVRPGDFLDPEGVEIYELHRASCVSLLLTVSRSQGAVGEGKIGTPTLRAYWMQFVVPTVPGNARSA